MDGHTNKLGSIDDPKVRQESEQLHADAIDALRQSKAFLLVTLDQDDTAHMNQAAHEAAYAAWVAAIEAGELDETILETEEAA